MCRMLPAMVCWTAARCSDAASCWRAPPPQEPSRFEKNVVRTLSNPNNEPRNSHARTPHHLLQGTVTPAALHFTINHSGLPDIDPEKHRLVIHGLVRQPKIFSL